MRARHIRKDAGLEAAIRAVGSMSALAQALGITVQSVAQWRVVPLERVIEVERATGVSRVVLRPDFFGDWPAKRGPLGQAVAA